MNGPYDAVLPSEGYILSHSANAIYTAPGSERKARRPVEWREPADQVRTRDIGDGAATCFVFPDGFSDHLRFVCLRARRYI
jgi:hypothetical protein